MSARARADAGPDHQAHRDLTRALLEADRLATLAGGRDEPSWVVDPGWRELRHVNAAARRLLGLELGAPAVELVDRIHPADQFDVGELTASGGTRPALRMRRADGTVARFAVTAVPRRLGDGTAVEVAFLAAPLDDAQRRAVDRSELLAAVGRSLARRHPELVWPEVAELLRRRLGARTSTLLDVADRRRVLAVDPHDAPPGTVAPALAAAPDTPAWSHGAVSLHVGPAEGGLVLVVEAPGADPWGQPVAEVRPLLAELGPLVDWWRTVRAHAGCDEEQRRLAFWRDAAVAERDEARHEVDRLAQARAVADRRRRERDDFLAHLSHELRNALNGVRGFAQIVSRDPLSDRQDRALTRLLAADAAVRDLLDEVLDLARAEAGLDAVEPEAVPVAELVGSVAQVVAPPQGPGPALDVGPGAEAVLGAPSQVRKVLANLVGNAYKHAPTGRTVRVSSRRAGPAVRIEVHDEGPGIPPADLERIFEPFERAGAIAAGTPGSGLGLTLARRLVEAMGGEIGVTSVVGDGSTFWFELPHPSAGPVDGDLAPTVVLATADPDCADLVDLALSDVPGARTVLARTGGAAAERLRGRPPVVVVDLDLPGAPTLLDALALSSDRPAVVVVTGDLVGSPPPVADQVLGKPLDLGRVAEVVASALGAVR